MSSVVIGILVAVFVWLFMRVRRARALQRHQAKNPAPAENPATMPRIGIPGSVTKDQLRRLRELHFGPSRHWSREEADLILDSVVYLRAAILQVTGGSDTSEDLQNKILAFILTDEQLRGYIISWGQNRRNKGNFDEPGELVRNEHFERVAAFITGEARDGGKGEGNRNST